MITGKRGVNRLLEEARQGFARWRKTRPPSSPIPEVLRAGAVKAASPHGVRKTARTLQLDYNALQKRLEVRVGPARRGLRLWSWCRRLPGWPPAPWRDGECSGRQAEDPSGEPRGVWICGP